MSENKNKLEKAVDLFENEFCKYTYKIYAIDDKTQKTLNLNVISKIDNLPHLLGLQNIKPYYKSTRAIKDILNGKIKPKDVSIIRDRLTRELTKSKIDNFQDINKVFYNDAFYKYNASLVAGNFDSDYLLTIDINNRKLHLGISYCDQSDIDCFPKGFLVTYQGTSIYEKFTKDSSPFTVNKISRINNITNDIEVLYKHPSLENVAAVSEISIKEIDTTTVKEQIINLYKEKFPSIIHINDDTANKINTINSSRKTPIEIDEIKSKYFNLGKLCESNNDINLKEEFNLYNDIVTDLKHCKLTSASVQAHSQKIEAKLTIDEYTLT